MNYLQLHFRGRSKWIGFPTPDHEFKRAREVFYQKTGEPHFMEFESFYGQSIWLNAANLQMVRFLLEMELPQFGVSDLKPSIQAKLSNEADIDASAIRWDIRIWLSGQTKPLTVYEVSGDDWDEITGAVQDDSAFFFITDEDGEELAVRVADIDLMAGLESNRYSSDQLSLAEDELCEEGDPA